MDLNSEFIARRLLEAYADLRSQILDIVEMEVGESPRWNLLRSRLLRYLGESGFEGKLRSYIGIAAPAVGANDE